MDNLKDLKVKFRKDYYSDGRLIFSRGCIYNLDIRNSISCIVIDDKGVGYYFYDRLNSGNFLKSGVIFQDYYQDYPDMSEYFYSNNDIRRDKLIKLGGVVGRL